MSHGQTKNALIDAQRVAGVALSHGELVTSAAQADGTITRASAPATLISGVVRRWAEHTPATTEYPVGSIVDIQKSGIAEVVLGAAVASGAKVTTDASGKGTTAATGNQVVGIALKSGVVGEYIPVQIELGTF